MTTTSVTLSGFVYDNAGNAVQDATVAAYTSADNATSAISGLTDTTDANGRWDLTTTDETKYPMDVKITFGSSTRWIKAGNGINVTRLTVSGAAVFGEDDTGVDVTMYGATSGRYLLWDQSEDALHLNDSTELKIGSLAAGDMVLYHDGTNSYIKNATGALKIATETSGIAVTIGHTTSEVTVADNLTVTGNLTVSGTQTIVDTVTMNAANAIVFEGATADEYETTLTIEDPTADRTVVIPNVGGTLAVLAADSDTAITATPAEINLIDGGTARGTTAIADGDGVLINDGGTMRMTTVETLATYLEGEIDAFSGRITADAGIDIDNITIDGTEIDLSSGDLTIDVAGDIVLDADGDDITFKAGTGDSTGIAFTHSGSGNWVLKNGTSNATLTIAGNDGGANVNALTFAMADAGKATFSGDVVVTGDLTVSGDDLLMGTNTDAYMLVADGTNYNPVAISGDIAITNAGVTSIASNSIVNADVNSSAAIADSKLATISTADKVSGAAIQVDGATDASATGTDITVVDADKFLIDDGGTTKYITASQLSDYIVAEGSMSSFQLEDDSGDEVTINNANEIKFIGSGIDINWTDTDNGTDADPYDLTFTLDFSDLSTVTPADGDFFATLDSDGANEQKTTTTALATLMAGTVTSTGISAASSVLKLDIQNMTASTTIADADLVVIDDGAGGTLRKMTRANFIESAALDAINIDGGAIDGTAIGANSASTIVGTTVTVNTSIIPDAVGGADIGSTSAEWGDVFIADDKKIKFGNDQDATIEYDEDGTDELRVAGNTIFEDHVSLTAGKLLKIGATTEADAFTTDDTAYGVTVTFEAGGTITLGRAVYIDSNGQVQHPDVEASGGVTASPAIGIATNGGSSGDTIYVLVLGIFREVSEFDLTAGGAIYLSDATNGKLTGTAPNDDGDIVQRMGVALSADMAFIMPSIDQIEHA